MKTAELKKIFENPPLEYRMLPLFRVNDEIDPKEVQWQIESLKEKGFGGIFSICEVFHDGAPDKFLSDWWWNAVDVLARACAKEGLEFWVYDDEDWPSGSLGGQLIEDRPEWNWHYLRSEETPANGSGGVEIPVEEKSFVGAVAFKIIEGAISPESIQVLSDPVRQGKISWKAPEGGDWTVAVYTRHPGRGFFIEGYGDLMNREAMAEFVKASYEGHWEKVKDIPGLNFKGYFTDEPACSLSLIEWGERFDWFPSMAFTEELPEAFRKLHGYDWLTRLPLLYHEDHPESPRFRCHHWETCCHLYSENYFKQIYDYCEAKGKLSSGHLVVEENFWNHLAQQGGNLMTHFRHMHIPGIDWIHPFENPLPATTPKYATSIAHLDGRERTWCETFAASGWGLTFQEMRKIVNWEHVNGINMQIPICYKYSMRGPSQTKFYNPGLSYQQPYWDHMRAFADYEARLCALAAGGGHRAQIALAYCSADIWSHCHEAKQLTKKSDLFNSFGDQLRFAGYDFDILDEKALMEQVAIEGKLLKTPTEDFEVLVFCGLETARNRVLQTAVDFARSGGCVLFVGSLPRNSYENGMEDPETHEKVSDLLGRDPSSEEPRRWNAVGRGAAGFAASLNDALDLLADRIVPDVVAVKPLEKMVGYHRELEDAHLYLLFNAENKKATGEVSLGQVGYPEYLNPETGNSDKPVGYRFSGDRTHLTLTFEPYEIHPIVLWKENPGLAAPAPTEVVREIPLPTLFDFEVEETLKRPNIAWNLTQEEDGWKSASPQVSVPKQIPLGDWTQFGLATFSGLGRYGWDLEVEWNPDSGRTAILELGRVAISAEVLVNSKSAGVVVFEPYRLDVTDYLVNGKNRIEVVVANTLSNYFSQFEELAGQPLNLGGDFPERRVSGWIGPGRLTVSEPKK